MALKYCFYNVLVIFIILLLPVFCNSSILKPSHSDNSLVIKPVLPSDGARKLPVKGSPTVLGFFTHLSNKGKAAAKNSIAKATKRKLKADYLKKTKKLR